ncbi:MAG: T9SS type A sorting domain-containing protein, partial [Bacteroidota bacterium]
VPGDLQSWTFMSFQFDASTIGGFDSTDFRDIFLFFDSGQSNFDGNDLRIDFFAIGEIPPIDSWSPCFLTVDQLPYVVQYQNATDPIFTGNAAPLLNQNIDPACEELRISVINPTNAPLGSFTALVLNPQDSIGNEIVDLSNNMRFFARVRSQDEVVLGMQLRSGDGSLPLRSNIVEQTVPAGLTYWTLLEFDFTGTNLAGFDSTDFKDIFIFLDRGQDNFRGNDFRIDFFAIGEEPDSSQYSPCAVGVNPFPINIAYDNPNDPVFSGGGAADLTQSIEVECSELQLSVADPANEPLGAFTPLILNPLDGSGNDITDFSFQMRFYLRVRSADSVRVGMQLRSGDGTANFRTDVLQQDIPDNLNEWTVLAFTFPDSVLNDFDSTDVRDVWLFLDRGQSNFRGNDVRIDFLAIGELPEESTWSDCPMVFPVIWNWTSANDDVTGGAGASFLTQTIDTQCEELVISVTDPVNAPHPFATPLALIPRDTAGFAITDLSENLRFYMRARSADTVDVTLQLRSGDGTPGNRSFRVEQTVIGGLQDWTLLEFVIDASNVGGFDSTDLRDIWIYLDRTEDNFRGNEFHIDFFSIGDLPNMTSWTDCPIPDLSFPYVLQWVDDFDPKFEGDASLSTRQEVTACEELRIRVDDPNNDPLGANDAFLLDPKDPNDFDYVNLTGQTQVFLRVRSEEDVAIGVQLRSADGGLTTVVSQTVIGDPTNWTILEFDFSGGAAANFTENDFQDLLLFLEPGSANFPGNDIFFDYIAIGGESPVDQNTPCLNTSIRFSDESKLAMYPNPVKSAGTLTVETAESLDDLAQVQIINMMGQRLWRTELLPGNAQYELRLPALAAGWYVQQLVKDGELFSRRLRVEYVSLENRCDTMAASVF